MSTPIKILILAVIMITGTIAVYFFTKPSAKDTKTTTTNQTNTGLASLDLGGLISSIYGQGKRVSQDNSYVSIKQ